VKYISQEKLQKSSKDTERVIYAKFVFKAIVLMHGFCLFSANSGGNIYNKDYTEVDRQSIILY
jgi:hypothetical protein